MRLIGYLGTLNKILQPTTELLITTSLNDALIISLQLVLVILVQLQLVLSLL